MFSALLYYIFTKFMPFICANYINSLLLFHLNGLFCSFSSQAIRLRGQSFPMKFSPFAYNIANAFERSVCYAGTADSN